jgi:hypothetical protein
VKFWERPDFIALQAEWYARLEESGFVDVERSSDISDPGRPRHDVQKDRHRAIHEERFAYYSFLGQNADQTRFRNDVDAIIMRMRAEGAKLREICEHLAAVGTPRRRVAVRYRIRIYEMKWGLRQYTPKQLGRYYQTKRQAG